jgi:hypothetical protein
LFRGVFPDLNKQFELLNGVIHMFACKKKG